MGTRGNKLGRQEGRKTGRAQLDGEIDSPSSSLPYVASAESTHQHAREEELFSREPLPDPNYLSSSRARTG